MSIKKGLGGDYLFFNSLEKDAQSLSKKELMFKMKKYEENEELIFPIFTQKKEEDQKWFSLDYLITNCRLPFSRILSSNILYSFLVELYKEFFMFLCGFTILSSLP